MKQPEFVMVSFDLFHERERRREGSVYSDQRTVVIDAKPVVKIQQGMISTLILIIKGLDNQAMKSLIISDNQAFHHVSPKFSNSPDDSPDQALKRIKI